MKTVFGMIALATLISSSALASSVAPGPSCNIEANKARVMVLADGTVNDEGAFRDQALTASYTCEMAALTTKWVSARATIQNARRACDEGSSGQSDLYRGTCHLRAAELLTFILGK